MKISLYILLTSIIFSNFVMGSGKANKSGKVANKKGQQGDSMEGGCDESSGNPSKEDSKQKGGAKDPKCPPGCDCEDCQDGKPQDGPCPPGCDCEDCQDGKPPKGGKPKKK